MKFFRYIIPFFVLLFPIIWIGVLGKREALLENIVLGLGGFFSSLFFYVRELLSNKKTRIATLQRIKERLNNETVLISHQESVILGPLMNDFTRQPGRIANATNNIEGLCLYKVTEKMKHKLERV